MKTVTTKAVAKVAAVATGLAMATSMLSLAPIAHAASLTASQVQSILSLLSSFGANSATIANVNAALTGGPVMTTTTTSTSCTFTKDLTVGSTGTDVTCLQTVLKTGGYLSANATGNFGPLTKAAVVAWQKAMGISPATGYFGAKSRAAYSGNSASMGTTTTTTTGGTTTTGVTGTGLKVMLSPTSPNGSVLVQGQGIGKLADFTFSNPTANPIAVTNLTFKRIGVSNDSTLTNVYLYNGVLRVTDSAGVSASQFSYNNATGLFTVPAGGTYTVSVRSDIAGSTSGQQVGVSLVSVASNGTLDSSVSFPVMSGYQTISAASLATVNFTVAPTPSTTSISPQNDYPIWQDTVSVSTNAVLLSSMKFTNIGSTGSAVGTISNLRLYVDGVQVGTAASALGSDSTVTFDLSAAPVLLSTQNHIIKVLANITGGASLTVQPSVQRSSDAMFVDSQLSQPVTPQYIGGTFSAVTTGAITINSVSGTTGISASVSPTSPTQAVSVGASSVKWASFTMLASGENVKVTDLYVYDTTSIHGGGLANGKVYFNGVQVGSTKNIGEGSSNATDFALGSSLILPAGQTVTVDLYADAKTSTSTNLSNNETVSVSLKSVASNAQGMSSLQAATVPSSAITGNTITVMSSSLTANKYTGYGNQTVIAGALNAKLGAFTLSSGSTEGVTVNTVNFSLITGNAASITNLMIKDESTGNQIGTTISTPSDTSNSFNVSFDIPASQTKTIGIYANILTSANVGNIQATITTSTTGTGDLTGTSASAASTPLQTITVGTGTLSATTGAGDPVSNNVTAGNSSVLVGQFNLAASNSAFTVQNVAILVPNGAATSVTNVTVSYKDVNGATQTATMPLSTNAGNAYATAAFTGLTMYVPANDSANLSVFVGTPTVAAGATSGAAINVSLDRGGTSGGNGTFKVLNSAGTVSTSINSGTRLASNGTFYVRKSIPTFAMLPSGVTSPSTGVPLYKFTVSADPAGAIEWTKLKFNVATSSSPAVTLTNVYLVDDASGVSLTDSSGANQYASTTATTAIINLPYNATAAQYAQVAAGSTKTYDLYGTVTGYGSTGSTLTISLASDASAIANEAALPQGSGNVEWSDRSATGHTISTIDWTNGYLLKNFTTNATTYTK